MLHVAVVEDNEQDTKYLIANLMRYGQEKGIEIEIQTYASSIHFLDQYRGDRDIVFMDIDMPALNGMDAARALRKKDAHVLLIFVTALARFALNGYEVDALDFIVKPLQYNFFSAKMTRAVKKLSLEKRVKLLIKSSERTVCIFADEIRYVDIFNHVLTFHMEKEAISTRGAMKDVLETLQDERFILANKSCTVNIQYVQMIDKDDVVLTDGVRIPIGRTRKAKFMQQIADYYGDRKIALRKPK